MASSKTAQGTRRKATGAAKRTLKGSKASSTVSSTKKTAQKAPSAAKKATKRTRRAPSQSEGTIGRPGPTPVEPPKPRPKRVGHLPIPQSTFFF